MVTIYERYVGCLFFQSAIEHLLKKTLKKNKTITADIKWTLRMDIGLNIKKQGKRKKR